jgi:hypothetical protein
MIKDAIANFSPTARATAAFGLLQFRDRKRRGASRQRRVSLKNRSEQLLSAAPTFCTHGGIPCENDRQTSEVPTLENGNPGSLKQTSFIIHYLGWQAERVFGATDSQRSLLAHLVRTASHGINRYCMNGLDGSLRSSA